MTNPAKALIGRTWLPRAGLIAFFGFFVLHPAIPPRGVFAADPMTRARARELVSQLGHEEFAMRERAAAELVALDIDATAALRMGTKSLDREIRHRSARLLALISQIDLERRFELFKKDTDPQRDYGLPGWDAYREVAGSGPAARSVFVSMHEDEPHLLGLADGNRKRLGDALANRCDQLRGQAMFVGRVQVRIGTTATLLFAATRDDVEVSPLVRSAVYIACSGSNFESAVDSGPMREPLVALAERWIDRQYSHGITYALHLGLINDLKGCLPRARELFQAPVATATDRIYACLCLCRFGDESDFTRLETYLEDVNICAQAQEGGQIIVTEMRDIALACLVRLANREPKDFGFDRLELDRRMVFNLSSIGFRDEPSRVKAIASWRELRRSSAKADAP